MPNKITVTLHREVAEEIIRALRGHAERLNEAIDACSNAGVSESTLHLIIDAVRISDEGAQIVGAAL